MEATKKQLLGCALQVSELSGDDITEMYALFQNYYDHTTNENFTKDLSSKNWVVIFREAAFKQIKGFSTLAFYESAVAGEQIGVVYSGDTIIDQDYWGTPELPKVWIRTVMDVGKDYPAPLYWFLISAGYKTYRFLSVFFKEFYPCYKSPPPENIKRIMGHLARERFGDDYRSDQGVVRFSYGATPLKDGIADIDSKRLKDEHVKYFLEKNPGYLRGDELVCLTVIQPDNFTPAGERMMR